MGQFAEALKTEIWNSRKNYFGVDNFDQHRFGNYSRIGAAVDLAKYLVKCITGHRDRTFSQLRDGQIPLLDRYGREFEALYAQLDDRSKRLIVKLVCYRMLGFRKVKLDFNNAQYWKWLKLAEQLKDGQDRVDPHFKHFMLYRYDLRPIGYDMQLYFRSPGIVTDFLAQQYLYRNDAGIMVQAEPGDVVLDLGGCWGDTALYFAFLVGATGRVYSFEFIPDNIKLFNLNTSLNPLLATRVELVPQPVSDVSDVAVYYEDNGPGSKVRLQPFDTQTGTTTTISIDDFVERNCIEKVDFIKMDIEGAEMQALNGARKTIKKFRRKLAIAIYHSLDDFVHIPRWISQLEEGYDVVIDHFTIHAEETICFGRPKRR